MVGIAELHHPPTRIHFPDHELAIPLDSWLLKEKEVHHDDPEFSFDSVLIFEEVRQFGITYIPLIEEMKKPIAVLPVQTK